MVFASWESGPRGYISAGQRCLERAGVGILGPCLCSCLHGLFSNCFLVSSRPVVVEKTEWVCPLAVTLVGP